MGFRNLQENLENTYLNAHNHKKDGKKFKIIPVISSWVRPKERHNGLSKSTKENEKAKYWMGVITDSLEWFQAFVTENDKDSNAESEPEDMSEAKPDDKGSLYKCPNDLCTADYIRFHNFARHLSEGVCKAKLRSI